MRRLFVGTIVLALASIACVAQAGDQLNNFSSEPSHQCNPAGTWYGGSNSQFAYQFTITPVAEPLGIGRYNTMAQQALDLPALGLVAATSWTGTMEKRGATYKAYIMAMYKLTPEFAALVGADPALPEVDVVRGHIKLVDCNTLTASWNVYYVYFNFDAVAGDKVPFVTAPDIDVLGGAGEIVETYHRLSSDCPTCSADGNVQTGSFPSAVESRKSRVPTKR